MKQVTIDLTAPFEEIETKLRSIPSTEFVGRHERGKFEFDPDVREVLRRLYEAARGRQVATQIGLVGIAPPLAALLVSAPFSVGTQEDFLLQALARLGQGSRESKKNFRERKRYTPATRSATYVTEAISLC